MNQALLAALQTTVNERNIILLVPYGCPEDDIITASNEIIQLAAAAKESRLAREAEEAKKCEEAQADAASNAEASA